MRTFKRKTQKKSIEGLPFFVFGFPFGSKINYKNNGKRKFQWDLRPIENVQGYILKKCTVESSGKSLSMKIYSSLMKEIYKCDEKTRTSTA